MTKGLQFSKTEEFVNNRRDVFPFCDTTQVAGSISQQYTCRDEFASVIQTHFLRYEGAYEITMD